MVFVREEEMGMGLESALCVVCCLAARVKIHTKMHLISPFLQP